MTRGVRRWFLFFRFLKRFSGDEVWNWKPRAEAHGVGRSVPGPSSGLPWIAGFETGTREFCFWGRGPKKNSREESGRDPIAAEKWWEASQALNPEGSRHFLKRIRTNCLVATSFISFLGWKASIRRRRCSQPWLSEKLSDSVHERTAAQRSDRTVCMVLDCLCQRNVSKKVDSKKKKNKTVRGQETMQSDAQEPVWHREEKRKKPFYSGSTGQRQQAVFMGRRRLKLCGVAFLRRSSCQGGSWGVGGSCAFVLKGLNGYL